MRYTLRVSPFRWVVNNIKSVEVPVLQLHTWDQLQCERGILVRSAVFGSSDDSTVKRPQVEGVDICCLLRGQRIQAARWWKIMFRLWDGGGMATRCASWQGSRVGQRFWHFGFLCNWELQKQQKMSARQREGLRDLCVKRSVTEMRSFIF